MASLHHPPTPSPSVLTNPPNQNTAPVHAFNCLYTHDLRRKCKRWHDGLLRFHTFNKRVMVYDLQQNFIGDTHYRKTGELVDGDELELERSGVIVQVGERTGKTDQDLSGLWEGRNKAREERAGQGSSPGETPRPRPMPPRAVEASTRVRRGGPLAQAHGQTLNALLGTARGPYGKAVLPKTSPYERREQSDDRRKRRRIGDETPRRQTAEESARHSSRPAHRSSVHMPLPGKQQPPAQTPPTEISDDTPAVRPRRPKQCARRDRPSHPTDRLPATTPKPPAHAPDSRPSPLPSPPLNPLRLPRRQARKKLLCQASSSDRPQPPDKVERAVTPPPRDETRVYHDAQALRLQARMSRKQEGVDPARAGREGVAEAVHVNEEVFFGSDSEVAASDLPGIIGATLAEPSLFVGDDSDSDDAAGVVLVRASGEDHHSVQPASTKTPLASPRFDRAASPINRPPAPRTTARRLSPALVPLPAPTIAQPARQRPAAQSAPPRPQSPRLPPRQPPPPILHPTNPPQPEQRSLPSAATTVTVEAKQAAVTVQAQPAKQPEPIEAVLGAWSIEAFDLFDYRPPR